MSDPIVTRCCELFVEKLELLLQFGCLCRIAFGEILSFPEVFLYPIELDIRESSVTNL